MGIDISVSIGYTLTKVQLYKRTTFTNIEPYIGDETIIVLHGARQVGKTHILFYIQDWLKQKGKKVIYYDLEYPELLADMDKGVDTFITDLKGRGYLEGEEIYVLVDEIQYLQNPSSFLKIIADHYKNIHLIVSGSSTFDIKSKFSDSLAGRTTIFEIFPLSFPEFLEFKEIDIVLSQASTTSAVSRLRELYKEFVFYGGYPKIVLESNIEKKKQYLLQIVDTYIRKDVRDLANIDDTRKFNNLLKVLAAQSSQILDISSLSRETTISFATLQKYLSILEETFVIKRVNPYSKSPSVEVSKNPKIFFLDSGLQSILWLNNFQSTILGSILETNIFAELMKKHGRQNIYFWRTKTHLEIDFIIETAESLLPVEVKTSLRQFNSRAIKSFISKYNVSQWKVIGLEGEKKSDNEVYPWEI